MLKEFGTEKLIAQLFDNQPDSVVWFRPVFSDNEKVINFEAVYANQAAGRILGVHHKEVIGTFLLANPLMDEVSINLIYKQCLDVWNTGEAIEHTYYSPGFDRYFNVQRSRVEDGILSITRDRTEEIKTEIERQEQEKVYKQILDTSADGIMLLKAIYTKEGIIEDFRITHCNKAAFDAGRFPHDTIGRTLLDLLPHMRTCDQFDLHKKVAIEGTPIRFETTFRNHEGEEYGWFIVSLTKLGDGVISTFVDVTEKRISEQELLAQTNFLNNILDASLSAVYVCEAIRNQEGKIVDMRFLQVNKRFRELSVRPELDVIGNTMLHAFPATASTDTLDKLAQVIETGKPERFEVHYHSDNFDGWYDTSAVKMGDNGVVVTYANITDQKQALSQIEKQRDLLEKLLRHSPSCISVVEAIRDEHGQVIDIKNILVNDMLAEFFGVPKEYLLARTGTEMDPSFATSETLTMLAATLRTGVPCFIDYHLPTGKWVEGAASKMDDDHLICIAMDVTAAKATSEQMQVLVTELQRSNASLEDFTSAASHDLKEPIRKVQFFTERLKLKIKDRLSSEELGLMTRVETAVSRMQVLVDDLLEYSHVDRGEQQVEVVDLNKKLNSILTDLELMILEKKAIIDVGKLPVVKGYRRQLDQMFQNLISNALKYQKADTPPHVVITSELLTAEASGFAVNPADRQKTFHMIRVEDNGIGFEQEYAEKIFNVFTRLHGNTEYAGTGVGLAIVKKVVENHGGYIFATSELGSGATFTLLLPA